MAPELSDMHMPPEGVFHNIVLASIHKHYPAQAVKVMTSLWGAGQMMFNKIIAIFDAGTVLHDYKQLARLIGVNTHPVQDVHFIQGPLDILDHSSRRYGFGSKVGIDATTKIQGGENDSPAGGIPFADETGIKSALPAVTSANTKLIDEGIPLLILAISKSIPSEVRMAARLLLEKGLIANVGFVIFIDSAVDCSVLSTVCWVTANNVDPSRDCFYVDNKSGTTYPVLFTDGTMKTLESDGFKREWPNVILMDGKTISSVDERWNSLGLGGFFPSPSAQFKSLVISDGAVANLGDR